MKFIKQELFTLILIALLAAVSVKALAIPEFYTSHDGETHTARLANFYLALEESQVPPQLAPTLFGGFGFPIFVFIYPLPYLVGSFFHFLSFSYTDSAELTMAVGQILSAVAIYVFFKLETKKTLPSFLAALFFTWAPYRFLMIFVRGAFAESFAYIFVATSLICLNRLFVYRNTKWIVLSGISLGGLLLSHQLVSVMFLPVLAWYFISKLIFENKKIQIIFYALLSLVIGFGLSAYIYVPAYFEREFLRFDNSISYTNEHFVTPWQLVRSPWGYGFSHPGVVNDSMSFQIGLTHLVVVALSLLVLLWSVGRKKRKVLNDPVSVKLLMWLFAFGLATILMIEVPFNHLVWEKLPGLSFVDFPWRFIGVAVATVSFLSIYLLEKTRSNLILFLFLGFFVFYANRNHLRINETIAFSDEHFETYQDTATWRHEFLPKKRITSKWKGIEGASEIWTGDGEITTLVDKTDKISLTVNLKEKSQVMLHRMYFPGWEFKVDDILVQEGDGYEISGFIDLETQVDYSGFIIFELPAGTHTIEATFLKTPLRKVGWYVSLMTLSLCVVLLSPVPKVLKKHL